SFISLNVLTCVNQNLFWDTMVNIYDNCGIKLRWINSPSIGGVIKEKPEDFVVEELPLKKEPGSIYTHVLVEKKNLETQDVVKILSNELNISSKKIGYAGNKDKRAVTKQWFSIQGVDPKDLVELNVSNIRFSEFTKSKSPIKIGDLDRNKFLITIRKIDHPVNETSKMLKKILGEIERKKLPNFFGPQRFGGKRPVTHLVGKEMIRGNFEEAVKTYLTKTYGEESEEAYDARNKLKENWDYSEALEYFPHYLNYERQILRSLKSSEDYLKALNKLPLGLRMLFVNAYQSWVYNLTLSRVLGQYKDNEKEEMDNFPIKLVGYKTTLDSDRNSDSIIKEILNSEGIEPSDFQVSKMSEVSSPGTVRSAFISSPKLKLKVVKEDEENEGKTQATLSFVLKSGSYATVLLREIMK
ncbi:MAG: tRNA pseudouridine(13) synthase TruD, partial [Candidatus Aenigmatarchaeota archaeon]